MRQSIPRHGDRGPVHTLPLLIDCGGGGGDGDGDGDGDGAGDGAGAGAGAGGGGDNGDDDGDHAHKDIHFDSENGSIQITLMWVMFVGMITIMMMRDYHNDDDRLQ
jgi:hypothetical protein